MRLLLIEGDPQARGALKARLLAAGADVVDAVEDVEGAVAQLRAFASDAALLGKPRGAALLAACSLLRADPALRGRPILVLGGPTLGARSLAAGASGVISRELDPASLGEEIAAAISRTKSHAALRLGVVAPREGREPLLRALAGAGYELDVVDAWPADPPATWAAAVAAAPPPAGVRAPIVPLWRGSKRRGAERQRPVTEVLETVDLVARPPPAVVRGPAAEPVATAPEVADADRLRESVARARLQVQAMEETARHLLDAPQSLEGREDLATQAYLLASLAAGQGLHETSRLATSIEAWARRFAASPEPLGPGDLAELAGWLVEIEASLYPVGRGPTAAIRLGSALLLARDRDLCTRFQEIAGTAGVGCRVVGTAEEAAGVASLEPPDVLVAEAERMLPPSTPAALRAVPALAEVPTVVLVRPGEAADRLAAVRLGGANLRDLPVSAEELFRYLRSLTDTRLPLRRPRVIAWGSEAAQAALREWGFEVASAGEDAEAIAAAEPDALLLDERAAPVASLLRHVRDDPRTRALPVVVLCEGDEAPRRVRALEAGADDALPASSGAEELAARLRLRIEQAARARAAQSRDPATGLATRRRFDERLEDELAIAERTHRPFAVVSLEPDDEGGRLGDRARQAISATLARELVARLRRSDLVAKSQDEFLLLLRECTCDDAQRVVESVLRGLPVRGLLGVVGAPSFTAGVASYPDHGRDAQLLLGAARRARAESRRAGGTAIVRVAEAQRGVRAGMLAPRVLIVDSDETVRRLVGFALEKRGYVVEQAQSGDEAVERLFEAKGKLPPDLVLLDVHVPFVDGFEILRRLRESKMQPSPRVVMLSGRSSDADIVHAFELGAIDHIAKPFSVPILLARVRAALARGRG